MIKITDKYYLDSDSCNYILIEKSIVQKEDSKNYGNETFKNIEFSLTQWSTKTFDKIYLEYYDGTSWIKCSEEMTIPQLIKTEILIPNIKMIRLSFS